MEQLRFLLNMPGNVRVLVLDDSEPVAESAESSQTSPFQAMSLKTKGFKFNREEANAR